MRVVVIGSTREIDERSALESLKAIRAEGHTATSNVVFSTESQERLRKDMAYFATQFDALHAALVPLWQTCENAVALVKELRKYPNVKFITAWGGHEVHWTGDTEDSIEHTLGDQIPEYKGGEW